MKIFLMILLFMAATFEITAQGITKNGQSTGSSSDFISKHGKTGGSPVLNKNGKAIIVVASISSNTATSILSTTTYSGGTITYEGGSPVTARGVCWNTSPGPTIANSKTTDGTGGGIYSSSLTGLTPGTLYYLRAYATNSAGTSYGNEISFTTVTLPLLTTTSITAITTATATSGGNITSDGGSAITERGVCWNTTGGPTILSAKTSNGAGTGSFTSSLSGLTAGTTYYVRAYATTSVGTAYGNELNFYAISIGTAFLGGKVAYLLQPGDPGYVAGQQHGLIAALSDQSTGVRWYNYSFVVTGATGTALGTGLSNTNTIVSKQGPGDYAARLCYDLVSGGYSDWYLPSIDELNKLYLNRAAIGGFGSIAWYWSSTECNQNDAMFIYFNSGAQNCAIKMIYDPGWSVRAVRSF